VGGSFAYEVVGLYKAKAIEVATYPYVHILVAAGLVLAAGIFAASWEDNKPWKCFYLGVTFPLWIAAWSSH
jgi:hypothetical protein